MSFDYLESRIKPPLNMFIGGLVREGSIGDWKETRRKKGEGAEKIRKYIGSSIEVFTLYNRS